MEKTFLISILLSFLLLQGCTTAQFKQDLTIDSTVSDFHQKVDSIVINKMNQYNIPGLSIGLTKGDAIIYSRGYGVRNIHDENAVTENTVFHTASISKLFTAVGILKLVKEGKLSLDVKMVSVLPNLSYKDDDISQVTVLNLLNHTSGLPDIGNYHWDRGNESDNALRASIMDMQLSLDAKPDTEYQYSNLGYNILGMIIEEVSGTNFDDFMKNEILDGSNMSNSDFRYFKIPAPLRSSPHTDRMITHAVYERKVYPYTREHAPSSTLNSSSTDLAKWMITVLDSLSNSSGGGLYNTMIEPSSPLNPYIGLGFQLGSLASKNTIGHYGGDRGFRSYLLMIPEEKIGLVVLANCDYNEDFRQEIVHSIVGLMMKETAPISIE